MQRMKLFFIHANYENFSLQKLYCLFHISNRLFVGQFTYCDVLFCPCRFHLRKARPNNRCVATLFHTKSFFGLFWAGVVPVSMSPWAKTLSARAAPSATPKYIYLHMPRADIIQPGWYAWILQSARSWSAVGPLSAQIQRYKLFPKAAQRRRRRLSLLMLLEPGGRLLKNLIDFNWWMTHSAPWLGSRLKYFHSSHIIFIS